MVLVPVEFRNKGPPLAGMGSQNSGRDSSRVDPPTSTQNLVGTTG